MGTSRGRGAVKRFMVDVKRDITGSLLPGAARAAAKVVADEAKARSISHEVAEAVKVSVPHNSDRIVAKVQVKGEGAYMAPWLEYGTEPHFISVDPDYAEGRTAGRVNRLDRQAAEEGRAGPGSTLIINGKPVGTTVHHPGAQAHPFLRPALDAKEGEAIAAAQAYIDSRIGKDGIAAAAAQEADEA